MDRQLRALELSNYEIDGQLMKDRCEMLANKNVFLSHLFVISY